MRILYLSMKMHNTRMREAMDTIGEVDQVDWVANRAKINNMVAARRGWPDLTFLHVQSGGVLNPKAVAGLSGVVVNWTGDVRSPIPKFYYDLAPYCTTMFSNETDVRTFTDAGLDAHFLNVGFDDLVFTPDGERSDGGEVVFMGNQYGTNHFPLSRLRYEMCVFLRERFRGRFALYGNGPMARSNNTLDWPAQAAILRGCKVAINLSHFDYERYTSDRMFRIMGSGAFCLTHRYCGLERDFTEGVHVAAWSTLDELVEKIDYYLAHDDERLAIASAGCELVRREHTWHSRMKELASWKAERSGAKIESSPTC